MTDTSPPPAATSSPFIPSGTVMGAYTLQGPIGLGADAIVYRGDGPWGPVAVKVPRGDPARDALLREAEVLRRHAHPHLARLEDVGANGEWLAVELVGGDSYDVWARGRPFEQVMRVAVELLGALEHLHRNRIVHADLKPTNVLIDDWHHPKLLDVGGTRTRRHTPGFCAPEVLLGARPGPPADVYGLGATIYAALVSRAPFDVADPAAQAHLATTSSPLPPSAWRPEIPARFERLLLSMLARDPMQRPDLRGVERDLLRAQSPEPARPMVGMAACRAVIHREVARAATGRPVVLVIYGPPGSGRRSLAQQAVRQARREGMRYLDKIDAAAFLDAQAQGQRPVMVGRARRNDLVDLARRFRKVRETALLVLYDTAPIPELDAREVVQVMPDALSRADVAVLCGALGLDPSLADPVWRASQGLPASAWKASEALLRPAPGATRRKPPPAPPHLAPFEPGREAARILAALQAHHGVHGVLALARGLKLHPHALLDELEPLVAAKLVTFGSDGQTVRMATEPSPADLPRSTL